jgi:hypothetical protein
MFGNKKAIIIMWTREEAFLVIEKLEPKLADVGTHVALAGSVACRGESDKDLDLIIYPHTKSMFVDFNFEPAKLVLKEFFNALEIKDCSGISQIRDDKKVSWLKTPKGKRVDFFFLQ